jgi:AcrR family transcriptional regulator
MSSPPRQRLSADQRREQLEVAAIRIVGLNGLSATTAESIAQAAGVSKGLLWRYYTDLEDLLLSAGRRALATLEAAVASDTDMDAEVTELFRTAIHRAARLPATHAAELQAVRRIAVGLRPHVDETTLRATEYRRLYAHQAALFARGQADGGLRRDLDPHLLAVTYQGMVDSMLDYLHSDPSLDPHTVADHVADVLLGGISTPDR